MSLPELLGHSPEILAAREQLGRLFRQSSDQRRLPPVLLLGETGTGKGLLARAIHRSSPRRAGPFVDVNCAAIPETLLESEMFGFERGAFTDARQPKPGLFQAAHGGVLFLDEVGLLPPALQSKLLTVIEDRQVRRLGSTRSEPADVWIISASNEDLATAVRERRFRPDLYHRLAVLAVRLPPLRERGEDVILLAEHFLERACADYGLPPRRLAADGRAALQAHPWPGNVRELANVMERVALLSEARVVTAAMLDLPATAAPRPPAEAVDRPLRGRLGALERSELLRVLEEVAGNLSRAAARLGIPRNTLRYRLEKHGIAPPGRTAPDPARRSPAPAAAPRPGPRSPIRWEPRRLTWLAAAVPAAAGDPGPWAGPAIELVADKVETFGGRVEARSPAGLLAAFGLEPVEDAPRRAAHAALAVHRAARGMEAGGLPAPVRLALHAAPSLVAQAGAPGEVDFEAKRQASAVLEALLDRLASTDERGPAIAVGESCVAFLERRFALRPLPGGEPPARRLIGHEPDGPAGRAPAFVGRAPHLELLESHLEAVLRGRGQAVAIVGEAGIGKSRLVAEFRRRLEGRPVTYREGACLSHGSAIPYLPVLEILRQNFGIGDADPGPVAAGKIRRGLEVLGLEPADAGPYLLRLLGFAEGTGALDLLSPEAVRLRTLDTLRRLVLTAARQRPVVVVVEDMHWIDRTSEELFAALAEDLPGTAVLLVTTYRPGYRPPWSDRSYASQIALPPLSPEDGRAMLGALLGAEVPEALARALLDRAEGNPFFLEELCRALGGPEAEAPAVPDTIHDVLLARIQRLPEAPRRLLQAAAVLGREATLPLLAAVWGSGEGLDEHLGLLTRLEFLVRRPGPGEPLYAFKHVLIQDVAYAALAEDDRQARHAAAARALEELFADRREEVDDRLALHYSRALDAARAVEYLERFADRSARAYAHEEAVRLLGEALTHARRLPPEVRDRRTVELLLRLPYSLLALGRVPEILERLLGEQERVDQLGDPALSGHYHFLLARTWSFLGDREQATRCARRAIAEAERAGDPATVGRAESVLALEGVLGGRAREALEHARRAVARLAGTGERWWLGDAHWLLATIYTQTGDFALARAEAGRAREVALAIGDPRLQASAGWVLGVIAAAAGDHEASVRECRQALERSPDPLNAAITRGWLGFTYLERGEAAAAVRELEPVIRQLRQFGFREFESWFTVFLAEAHRLAGRLEEADDLAAQALKTAGQARFPIGAGWAGQSLGRIALARGEVAAAGRHLEEALATFEAVGSRYEAARTRLDLAAVARAAGDREQARRQLAAAGEAFTALDLPQWADRARARLAEG